MGCDIHMYCEVKPKKSQKWLRAGRIFKNSWDCTKKEFVSIDEDGYSFGEPYTLHPYSDRSYDLFGMLAGVRNGTWGQSVTPISLPKGLPSDVSDFVKKECDGCGCDGHSHSYLAIDKLEKYNWHQMVKMNAFVSKEQARDYLEKGKKPESYSAWASNGVKLEWDDDLYPKQFVEDVLPQLVALKKFGEVRIVFWFDN